MTPKEKAIELINKMSLNWYCNECHNDFAKECALIAVNVILIDVGAKDWEDDEMTNSNYWQEVKQEIEKL